MYFVEVVRRATENNVNKGDCHVYVYGKKNMRVAEAHSHQTEFLKDMDFYGPYAKQYGYTRMCDACRNWCFKNTENDKYWESYSRVIWLDC